MILIGERINSTHKSIAEAIKARDSKHIQQEALTQVKAGVDYVDVNAGTFQTEEPALLTWLVKTVQEVVDTPLCIDTANPEAAAAALRAHKGKALLNSTTGQKERYEAFVSLVKEAQSGIVALCINDMGTPKDTIGRLAIAERLIENLSAEGIPLTDIYIDPLVHPIGVEQDAGLVAINTISAIKQKYPEVGTIIGLSNISFGLPARLHLNRIFLILAMGNGLSAAILDPTNKQTMVDLLIAQTLLGKDEHCAKYLSAYRKGQLHI